VSLQQEAAAPAAAAGASGLSCYTANLRSYLAREWDADAVVARSVRLAVEVDRPDGYVAFSHHEPSLDRLPDGSWLTFAGCDDTDVALHGVARSLDDDGSVLVVVDQARVPWSVLHRRQPAPHWLLVDGRDGDRWHVADDFAALTVHGEQFPHRGWVGTDELASAMRLPPRWEPEQELRNEIAFGSRVVVPPHRHLWLRRTVDRPPPPAGSSAAGRWLVGDEAVLPYLIDRLGGDEPVPPYLLDDIWAVAGHRSFAHRWRLGTGLPADVEAAAGEALSLWEKVPQLLRFAAASAARGKPRHSLVRATLEAVLAAEAAVAAVSP
jgi:hypothetical protein